MGTSNSIDVKIATFFKRAFNFYIKKRTSVNVVSSLNDIWIAKFIKENFFIHELENNIKIKLYKDSILCRLLYFGFETTEIEFIKRFLKKDDIFVDIGSNIGLFSLFASGCVGNKGKVFALEPTPLTFERLNENIKLNNFTNIETDNIGLSNKTDVIDFTVSNNGHDAWNSFAKLDELKDGSTIKVKVETLDDFIKRKKVEKIDLIKLDVEGWEKFVLEGSVTILEKVDAPVFLVEFTEANAFAAGYYLGELFDYMKSFGYEWYSYNAELNSLNNEVKKLHYPYENLIAIKNFSNCIERLNNS